MTNPTVPPSRSPQSAAGVPLDTAPPPQADDADPYARIRRVFWQGRFGPAFWTITSVISLTVNLILIIVLLLLAGQIFRIKELVGNQLIGGLYDNFVKMDQAHIRTTILVSDTIHVQDTMPVVMNIPLQQETAVILTRDTPIRRATVMLNGAAVPTDLVLRQGTKLNIYLDLNVPVNQVIPVSLKVPVRLTVPVDIPLAETELHEPFVGLQQVIGPYNAMIQTLPGSWGQVFCGSLPEQFCK